PVLEFTLDDGADGQYEYLWFAVNQAGVQAVDKRTDLSTTRNLDITIALTPSEYLVYYIVKDLETGVEFRTSFELFVGTSIYEGWLVLGDVNGTARLDMISLINEEYTVIPDVLAFTGS